MARTKKTARKGTAANKVANQLSNPFVSDALKIAVAVWTKDEKAEFAALFGERKKGKGKDQLFRIGERVWIFHRNEVRVATIERVLPNKRIGYVVHFETKEGRTREVHLRQHRILGKVRPNDEREVARFEMGG